MKLRTICGLPSAFSSIRETDASRFDRRPVHAKSLAEGAHPQVILIELLASGKRAPRNQFVDVRIARVVADGLRFEAGPRRRGNDLAGLGDDIGENESFRPPSVPPDGRAAVPSPSTALPRRETATSPLVSGASIRIVSAASTSLSMRGNPAVGPSPFTAPFSALKRSISGSVFQAIPLPPLPSRDISGPSAVKRAYRFG